MIEQNIEHYLKTNSKSFNAINYFRHENKEKLLVFSLINCYLRTFNYSFKFKKHGLLNKSKIRIKQNQPLVKPTADFGEPELVISEHYNIYI